MAIKRGFSKDCMAYETDTNLDLGIYTKLAP